MTDFYFRRVGAGTSGTNSGLSESNAFQGIKKLSDEINAGNITAADNIYFVPSQGPIDLQDRAQFSANTRSVSTGFTDGSSDIISTTAGILLGSSRVANSTLSGRKIFWRSSWAQPSMDMRGLTTNSQRMMAGIRLQGESVLTQDFYGYAADWPYLRTSTNPTHIPGPIVNAEEASYENITFLTVGNGIRALNMNCSGSYKWSNTAFAYYLVNRNVTGQTNGIVGELTGKFFGTNQGIDIVETGGGGFDCAKDTRLLVHDVTVYDASWGNLSGMSGSHNAAAHGNGIRSRGVFRGAVEIYDFDVTGEYQDAVVAIGYVNIVRDGYIHDFGASTVQRWQWNSTSGRFELETPWYSDGRVGHGVKCGLDTFDGGSPSTWLGADGAFGVTATSSQGYEVDECRSIVTRVKMYNLQSSGIISNEGRGTYVHACEIYDFGGNGISFKPGDANGARNGNFWISNTFVRKIISDPLAFCLDVEPRARVCGMYNNIFWSNPSVAGQYDVRWNTTVAMPANSKDKNLLVTGRVSNGSGASYPTTGDLTNTGDRAHSGMLTGYAFGSGLSEGHSLINAGSGSPYTKARTYGVTRNILAARFAQPNPNVGPY